MTVVHFARTETQLTYTGLAADAKPTAGVPAGSIFIESDLLGVWRFDGTHWWRVRGLDDAAIASDRLLASVESLIAEVRRLRIGMIAAGTCQYIDND